MLLMSGELKVIADFYDFMLWLIRHVEKFPRHHRYSPGGAETWGDLQKACGRLS